MDICCPIDCRKEDLSVFAVLQHFKDHSSTLKPTYPAIKPKAGEIYLHLLNCDKTKGKSKFIALQVRIG